MYELKYAFLYGYNGTTFAIPGTSLGVHTGDLEHVTIRVDARRMMWVLIYRRDRSWLVGKDNAAQPGVKMTTRVHEQEVHEGLIRAQSCGSHLFLWLKMFGFRRGLITPPRVCE